MAIDAVTRDLVSALVLVLALALALAARPWRALAASGPPWPWLAWWAVLPLWWGADLLTGVAIVQPLSGVPMLVLLAGWPLAMLSLPWLALLVLLLGGLDTAQALQRLLWLGVVPGSLALLLGLATRRWLPRHLFVFILARGFFGTWAAVALSGALAWWLTGAPAGVQSDDLLLARFLSASGEAVVTGMLTAICVAFRPGWLATYSDRLYLPRD